MMTDDEILHTALATNTTNEKGGAATLQTLVGGGGLFSFLFNLNERIVWLTFSCGE